MRYLLLLLLFIANISQASITDLKLSTAQIFDVQWSISAGKLNASSFNYIYSSINYATQTASAARWTSAQTADAGSNGRYIGFFNSTTNPGTYGMAVFNSDGTKYKIINNTGSFRALANGAIFYNGNGTWGTLITTGAGYNLGGSGQFTITQEYPTNTQLQAYAPPSSTPLAAGQTAQAAPTYISTITTTQQANVNAATNLRNTITKNSVYIEQVGANNQVTVTQDTRYNMVAGTGATAAPVQGDYNTITIRQGDPANSTGKNLVQLSVYGSYNTLNLNQGKDQNGNNTGADVGGHMQYIIVSGNSNSVTTQQQNLGTSTSHYLETNITGNTNTQNITQLGNATKQVFVTTSGNSNTLSSYQDGLGAHYLNLNFLGNSNDAQITQTGNTRNAATINLTNSGAPASVTLQQTGGQIYNIDRTCTTTCGRVTVTQP
jgi:hypothetical protein